MDLGFQLYIHFKMGGTVMNKCGGCFCVKCKVKKMPDHIKTQGVTSSLFLCCQFRTLTHQGRWLKSKISAFDGKKRVINGLKGCLLNFFPYNII